MNKKIFSNIKKYNCIFEIINDGVCIFDQDFIIQYVNNRFCELLGQQNDTFLGKSFFDFICDQDKNVAAKKLTPKKINNSGFECHFINNNGEKVWFLMKMTNLNKIPDCEGFCATISDIKEKNRSSGETEKLNKKTHHVHKLETLGTLAGSIAHDFNNLLVTVLGNAELALLKINKESPYYNHINNVRTAAIRASGLTNQMLAYSSKKDRVFEPINLNAIIEEMINLLKVSISKNITLKFNFDENLPAIEADEIQIRQVIMNLVKNASESIGDNRGVIAIKTGTIKEKSVNYVSMEISDNGSGIDKKILSKIFEPFFTTKSTGTGLGLSIVKEVVNNVKGRLTVENSEDKGAVCKIMIPASKKQFIEKETLTTESVDLKIKGKENITVLLIDDDSDVLNVTKDMLETMKFKVYTACSGDVGLKILSEKTDINLLIIDMTMPGMKGDDVFRKLRKINRKVPVIFSSGFSEQDIRTKLGKKISAEFIQKPYQIQKLIEKIYSML